MENAHLFKDGHHNYSVSGCSTDTEKKTEKWRSAGRQLDKKTRMPAPTSPRVEAGQEKYRRTREGNGLTCWLDQREEPQSLALAAGGREPSQERVNNRPVTRDEPVDETGEARKIPWSWQRLKGSHQSTTDGCSQNSWSFVIT
ncbi:MAG: hypothetical protein ACFFD4_09875 [Candidatus Odinarchaeota archaeon]